MDSLTVLDPHKFERGDIVVITGKVHWYRRLWRWLTRWKPTILTVIGVDYENGVVTVDSDVRHVQ